MGIDIYHDCVINALEKDGWIITHSPLPIKLYKKKLFVDIGAEKIFTANKDSKLIAVEVKSFLNQSTIFDFHSASGQYNNYKGILKKIDPERVLYLAVSEDTYKKFMDDLMIKFLIRLNRIKMLIFNPITQEIVKWK